MTSFDSDRRKILKAGGTALTIGLAGCSAFADGQGVPGTTGNNKSKSPATGTPSGNGNGGSNGTVPPQVADYLSDANLYEGSVEDMTGQSEVTVEVGAGENGFAFSPPAIRVDPGTKVIWEWTGNGGKHNVVNEGGNFESELVGEQGHTFEHTFEEEGNFRYYCNPHKATGMKGAIIVGGGGGGGGDDGGVPDEVDSYLSEANLYEGSVEDMTGQSEVTVEVGAGENGFAFSPPAIRVDPGTKVIWEWTGNGGKHNVVNEGGNFESELVGEQGHTFEHTFEEEGNFRYYCNPHKATGMKGAIIVGGGGGGGGSDGASSVETPGEVDSYLSEANGYDGSTKDMTGQSEVTVKVGTGEDGFGFTPPSIKVDSGTKVIWEWTGKGGSHNVVHQDGDFKSELVGDQGHTFEHTFENSGNFMYYCNPHKSVGMKGAVIVE